ncbi:hypothetical protein ACXYTJ_13395 [Gilvimarinus sp. F26214L]|uniref:hypothetical protein n=1 Tax=Gilvimarinus sp. DZF01 TaxID=3461371 RepID=UPI004045E10F
MDHEIQQLIEQIADYCKRAEISESTFGRQVVNDGKFVSRLRSGRGVTLRTLGRIREYIRNHPPGPDSISEKDAALKLVDNHFSRPVAAAPAQGSEAEAAGPGVEGRKTRRPFRFYENRQKYLHFVHTCNEKWAISQRAGKELKLLQPSFPALKMFDAGMGDGTVLTYVMQNLHRRFPTVPFFVNAKEMSLEDVRLGLSKLPDRLVEHPATVFVISNMAYNEAPWLSPHSSDQPLNWHEIALEGGCAHEYGEQIEALHGLLDEGWQTRPSPRTGNPLYALPSVLVIYRADQRFMLESVIPPKGAISGDYDFILAAQPWQARVSAEFKVKRILAPLSRSLAPGGRLLGVQSYGDDPGSEIVQSIWPDENPFTVNRHVLLRVLKDELGPESREFHFNAMSDAKSVFRYEMHILPTEIGDHIGSSTLFAAWNAAIYVNQIQDDQLEEAVASGQYLQATREVLKRRSALWFNDETFVVSRKR